MDISQSTKRVVPFRRVITQLKQLFIPDHPVWNSAIARLRDAEDQAQRSYIWGAEKKHDHFIFESLDRAHCSAIDELWNDSNIRIDLELKLKTLVGSPPKVTIVHRCSHFASSYALNRFLVLLLKRYLEENQPKTIAFQSQAQVTDIMGVYGHECKESNPRACLGKPHQVFIQGADCWGSHGDQLPAREEYNVIIVRHGANLPDTSNPRVLQPRQNLPYHVSN